MKVRALVVPRGRAESARQWLKDRGWLSTDFDVTRRGTDVVLPMTPEATGPYPDGAAEELELEPRPRDARSYRDEVPSLTPGERKELPRSFDVIGDIVLIRLTERWSTRAREIGEALLRFVPGARKVGWDHGVQGPTRRHELEALAGEGGWRTVHQENGLSLVVDLERAYFSPRLAREHARVAALVTPGERVLDLCCGIGPFGLTIARDGRARGVRAADVNPDAIALLTENARSLGLADRIRGEVSDVREFVGRSGTAERVVFNLPREGIMYLTSVSAAVERGGTLHFYEIMERSEASARPAQLRAMMPVPAEWRAEPTRVVHPYSPSSDLVTQTLRRGAPGD